jgi:phosphatidylinositol alpha-mannosyltransferase
MKKYMKEPLRATQQNSLKKQSLKIGFVFDDTLDSFDGVAQYVKTLGKWFSEQGHEVRYLVGETKLKEWAGGKIYSLSKNQTVAFNGNQVHIPLPANRRHIKQVLEIEKFDVLHVQVPYSPFMAQRVISEAQEGTAIIGTFHILPSGVLSSWGSRLLKLMYGRSIKKFGEIVSVSAPAAKFAESAYSIKSAVVPNAVDVSSFIKAIKNSSRGEEQIVFLGRLVKRKGCAELIKAFRLLNTSRPKTKLIIAGKGPERTRLEKLVKRLKLGESVEFLGFIKEADKPSLLASADISCFPALSGESFGIVLIESMAAGSGVVVGGNNPGYSSVLSGRPELLVNSKDHMAFANKLQELLENKKLASDLHDWQTKEVEKYDITNVGTELLKRYNRLIAKKEA